MEDNFEKINIYLNKNEYGAIYFNLSKNLEEFRKFIELYIPNNIIFTKEQKYIKNEEEKEFCIKNILQNSNTIYLKQEHFLIFLDNKLIKKEINIFKNQTVKTLLEYFQKEFPKIIEIKCESNLVLKINEFFDEKILINDILIGNSIYIFSLEKKIDFKNSKYGYFLKINGNINFKVINWKKIEIFSSFLLDNNDERFLKESPFEIKRKSSIEEYTKFKSMNKLTKEFLEKFISNNKINDEAIFDYLMILKDSKDPKFGEQLKKYAFILDMNRLRKLDTKFKNTMYDNYFDEKTNLINFLKNVINGFYDYYDEINNIICEINGRHSNQNDIINPFINNFNKDNYINCPIQISDNNLFFHYIRVKFSQFLQNAFLFIDEFNHYCEILYDKIKKMTEE